PAAAAAPAPAAPTLGGPLIPGVCLLSREGVLANAKVGVYASQRIRQLTEEAQAEVNADRKPIEADLAALRAQAPKLTPEQRAAQEKALAARFAPVQAKADQRTREIEATRVKAVDAIGLQLQPVIAAIYTQKGCGLLFDRNTVLGGNLGNDLTAAVVAGLDARLTSITIERENLPAPAPAAPAK
ncbi:MAG: OmpH family outer membrane protein, partial [Novosphingobium sp.]|nr:OmpH family outer membrane protein [Novosphingobium sp.]